MEVSDWLHTPAALPCQGKRSWYQLDRRLNGPQSRSRRGDEEKNFQPLPGIEPLIIEPVDQSSTTELSRFFIQLEYFSKIKCAYSRNLIKWIHVIVLKNMLKFHMNSTRT
jgi:hypothetical protein